MACASSLRRSTHTQFDFSISNHFHKFLNSLHLIVKLIDVSLTIFAPFMKPISFQPPSNRNSGYD